MRGPRSLNISGSCRASLAYLPKKRSKGGARPRLFCLGIIMAALSIAGCSHFNDSRQARTSLAAASDLFHQGNYQASLDKYAETINNYPATADRVLFEMAIIYAYPKNEQKDQQKSLEYLQKLITDYPESAYRQNGAAMLFTINNAALKDKTIAGQQREIETLRHGVEEKEHEIVTLQAKIAALEQRIFNAALQKGAVDRILIEKSARRLLLISQGEVLKSYKIALGGNPIGPKERQGDNRTPEGVYVIDARNKDSRYHLSLHISYPNEKDKKRARELGVSPGGDIMIHGIKNGFSWVGDAHAEADWTKGCIAVTDDEIEEIGTLAPKGTIVEIRP